MLTLEFLNWILEENSIAVYWSKTKPEKEGLAYLEPLSLVLVFLTLIIYHKHRKKSE